ncbi:MAG: 5'-methylthioadenosine/adenosylhomocysteine nucleosidase [Oscillospiraceae bacterium]|nr:5'-methylthioadenosine/adenosylhomocysteine nucleosidase [Oscillospiraceae bacterium]MDD6503674.1 5'-methylthioadenosine/adenosylhomocysteine nucleosidase [Oscillospiraceae bacterium]
MTIGIIAAMDLELNELKAAMADTETETVSGIEFVRGTVEGRPVVAAVCGIGKVYAAMCAQTMILRYAPDAIVNIGVAGTLTKDLGVMDIAIAGQVCQHDMDTSALGDPVGLVSGADRIYFPADLTIVGTLEQCADTLGFRHSTGTIASGDQFIHTPEKKQYLSEQFGAIAAEMEGGSVGQVCFVNGVPFAVLRTISDGDGGTMDYNTFAALAARNSIQVVRAFIAAYGG